MIECVKSISSIQNAMILAVYFQKKKTIRIIIDIEYISLTKARSIIAEHEYLFHLLIPAPMFKNYFYLLKSKKIEPNLNELLIFNITFFFDITQIHMFIKFNQTNLLDFLRILALVE